MRIDLLEAALDRLDAEGRVPKFIYTVPSFQNPAGVTMSLERRRRLVAIARERELLVLEDNPYGLLRYEGEPLPTLLLARRRRVRHLPRHVLEDPLPRPAARLDRRRPRPVLEKLNLGKQAADLCSSLARAALRGRLLRRARLARLRRRRSPALYRRRRDIDARGAGRAPAARGDLDAPRRAGCSSGRRCRTTSTRPTCWPARCASTSRSCPGARRTSTAAAARRCG